MIKYDYRGVDSNIIGSEHGLNVQEEFNNYREKISQIITDLYQHKDTPGQWLQWMNLAYTEETVWYVKEYASMVMQLEEEAGLPDLIPYRFQLS